MCNCLNFELSRSPVIDQVLEDPELRIKYIVADMPERLSLKGLVSHSGQFSCEVCEAAARTNPINWPFATTFGKQERTRESILTAAR